MRMKKRKRKETVWEQLDRIKKEHGKKWYAILSKEFGDLKASETP